MSAVIFIFIMFCVLIAGSAYTAYTHKQVSLFSRSIVYICLIFIVISVSLFAYSRGTIFGPLRHYLDMKHGEFNHTATFSAWVLFLTGLIAILVAFFGKQRSWWLVLHWVYIAGLFVFLSLDEYFSIHENINHWERYYIVVAGLSALVSGAIFWRVYRRQYLFLYLVLYGSMAFAAVGGVGIEEFTGENCFNLLSSVACGETPILEETFEMLGFTAALASLMLLAEQVIEIPRWQNLKKWITGSAVVWLGILIFSYWLQPTLENNFLAVPVQARFLDGQMVLSGYRISADSIKPNERFTVMLYWYIDKASSREYGYTVNLLHPETGESIARINSDIINPPTTAWFVGTTHRTALKFLLPEDIETPVSPHVVITVWRNSGDSYETLNPGETDLATFDGAPIIRDLSILSVEQTQTSGEERFVFDNGAQIEDYELSQIDEQIEMNFYWSSSSSNIETNLSQIMHLIHEDGADFFIFDRHPFSGDFPTSNWIAGMLEVDRWQITIPNDAPTGNYTLYTGLYNLDLGQRVPVTLNDGSHPLNELIPIANITIPE